MNPHQQLPETERSLSICVIGSTYPRHADDYAVPWLRTSVAEMSSAGHRVTVLAPSFEGLRSHRIDESEVIRFRYAPKWCERLTHEQGAPNRIRNSWYQALAVPYVLNGCASAWRLARRKPFDVVHVHWPFPHEPMGWLAARASDAPLVMTCHGAEFALARRKPWVRHLLRRSLLKADKLIANSSDTANKIFQLSGRSAEVVAFGATVQPRKVRSVDNQIPRILFTGRLIQRKGVEYLLQAVRRVLEVRPVQLVITGDGDQRDRLETITDQLGIRPHVQFLGYVDSDRLGDEYANCDIWVNPSIVDDRGDTEGLGVGAIEAYTYGKPVIASAVGGIPDAVIDQQTGRLVPEKDSAALADAILELVHDADKCQRFAAAGMHLAEKRFSWSGITTRMTEIYQSEIRRCHSRSLRRRSRRFGRVTDALFWQRSRSH